MTPLHPEQIRRTIDLTRIRFLLSFGFDNLRDAGTACASLVAYPNRSIPLAFSWGTLSPASPPRSGTEGRRSLEGRIFLASSDSGLAKPPFVSGPLEGPGPRRSPRT